MGRVEESPLREPLQMRGIALDILPPLEECPGSCSTPRSGDPAVEPSRPVLMVEHSGRQQVLPECADRSGDGLPGTITIADVV